MNSKKINSVIPQLTMEQLSPQTKHEPSPVLKINYRPQKLALCKQEMDMTWDVVFCTKNQDSFHKHLTEQMSQLDKIAGLSENIALSLIIHCWFQGFNSLYYLSWQREMEILYLETNFANQSNKLCLWSPIDKLKVLVSGNGKLQTLPFLLTTWT